MFVDHQFQTTRLPVDTNRSDATRLFHDWNQTKGTANETSQDSLCTIVTSNEHLPHSLWFSVSSSIRCEWSTLNQRKERLRIHSSSQAHRRELRRCITRIKRRSPMMTRRTDRSSVNYEWVRYPAVISVAMMLDYHHRKWTAEQSEWRTRSTVHS